MLVPSSRRARAEHSMCQPGRPGPHCRGPRRLVGRRRLPQDEVERVALDRVVGVPAPLGGQLQHLLPAEVADLAEVGERGHVEVDPAARLVGVAPVHHHPDEAEDVVDGRRGPGLAEGGEHAQGLHVAVELGHLPGGQVEVVHAHLAGLAQQVVVDVGDVAHAQGAVADVAQPALEDVVEEVGGGVADVGGVVRRDAARVHGDDRPRREVEHLAPGGVEEPQPGGPTPERRRRCR